MQTFILATIPLALTAGKGGSAPYIPPQPVLPPEPPAPVAPASPEKSRAELELEEMKANKSNRLASMRMGRKGTFLAEGVEAGRTVSGGLLTYESMTNTEKSTTLG